MFKRIQFLAMLLSLCVLSGCVTRYTVVLNSGSVTTSKGKPKIKSQYETVTDAQGKERKVLVAEYYEFEDVGGDTQRFPLSRIAHIYPASDNGKGDLYYIPNDYNMPDIKKPKLKKKPWYKK
ncbi:MAG: hypothetical protein CMO80_22490 [Verrucomicrobiales bacterium]|nr:hypothetical protein [Verrucomicrobiales bacterium]|tara:strand:- start:298 stop:663 length:366 start_codon:yes stop_codon:yes gene_type:complete